MWISVDCEEKRDSTARGLIGDEWDVPALAGTELRIDFLSLA
jgi:hypothetical protein